MAGITRRIRQVLESSVMDITGLVATPSTQGMIDRCTFENVDFTPEPGMTYLRTVLAMDTQRPAVLGPSPFIRHEGTFLIDVHIPVKEGPGRADDAADMLREYYAVNRNLTLDDLLVRFHWAERQSARQVGEHYSVSVSVRFYAHHRNEETT